MNIQTPEWVKNAVFYQIFPDRFRRSERTPHPRGISFKPWGAPPEEQGYQGGDLFGVAEKMEYFHDLGINALYLTPIFSSASNHRYHAFDYMQVDPLLGGEPALRELLDRAHHYGIRIVLDGVFNHASRGFWPFHHILENGPNSPFLDWFIIKDWPLRPYSSDKRHPLNYAAWWDLPALPKLNTDNPGVRDYIFTVARYWLDFGIDGWRLDVPTEIKDDSFWREFREVVKGANPDAYIVGEIWHEASHWLQGDMFDAVMNYQFTAPVLNFFGADSLNRAWSHQDIHLKPIRAARFRKQIETMFGHYDWAINCAQMNMLDSHDMPRALWLVNNDEAAFRLVVLCQMTMPGAPCVYYGDEVGMSAGGDPYCREAFPWHKPETWNTGLGDFYTSVIRLRQAHPVLRTGDITFLVARETTVAYRRNLGQQEAVVLFNAGKVPQTIHISSSHLSRPVYQPVWPHPEAVSFPVGRAGLTVELLPQSGQVLLAG